MEIEYFPSRRGVLRLWCAGLEKVFFCVRGRHTAFFKATRTSSSPQTSKLKGRRCSVYRSERRGDTKTTTTMHPPFLFAAVRFGPYAAFSPGEWRAIEAQHQRDDVSELKERVWMRECVYGSTFVFQSISSVFSRRATRCGEVFMRLAIGFAGVAAAPSCNGTAALRTVVGV